MIECEQLKFEWLWKGGMYQYRHVLSISDSYFELQNGRHIKIYTLLYSHNVIVRALYFIVVSLTFKGFFL